MLRFWSVTLQQLLLKFTRLLLFTRVYPNYTLVLQHDSDYICKGYAVSFCDQTWQWTTCIAATTCWLGVPSQKKIPMNLVIVVISMYILISYIYIYIRVMINPDRLIIFDHFSSSSSQLPVIQDTILGACCFFKSFSLTRCLKAW